MKERQARNSTCTSSTSSSSDNRYLPSLMPYNVNLPPPWPSSSATVRNVTTGSFTMDQQLHQLGSNSGIPAPIPPPPPRQSPARASPGAFRGSGSGVHQQPQPLHKGGRHVVGRQCSERLTTDPMPLEGSLFFDNGLIRRDESIRRLRESKTPIVKHQPPRERRVTADTQLSNTTSTTTTTSTTSDDNEKSQQRLVIWGMAVILSVLIIAALVVGVELGLESSDPESGAAVGVGLDTAIPPRPPPPVLKDVFSSPDALPIGTLHAILSQDVRLPQVQAFEWLAQDEHLPRYSQAQRLQRFALATLFYATNGPRWFNHLPNNHSAADALWLDYNTHECDWYSLAVYNQRSPCYNYTPGVSDRYQHYDYQSVVLSADAQYFLNTNRVQAIMEGTLVPELGLLTNLQELNVGYQTLKGTIPMELLQLSATLRLVYLQHCYFSGTIPSGLFEFPRVLYLSRNPRLDPTTLPTLLGKNTELTHLLLTEANIAGTIPTELGRATRLQGLYLNDNELNGSIPSELGHLTGLQTLELTANFLTGVIPSELGQLQELQLLELGGNYDMAGTLPRSLSQLSNLEVLGIFKNSIQGSLWPELFFVNDTTTNSPEQFFVNGTTATSRINDNATSTLVPSWPKLHTLLLTDNELTGPIPSEIGLLESAKWLFMSRNGFESHLPSELGLLSNLECLGISQNELTGDLPSEVKRLPNLVAVSLPNNLSWAPSIQAHFVEVCGPDH